MIKKFALHVLFFIDNYKKKYYTSRVRSQAKKVGTFLKVNGKSSVSGNTILGNNVNFNGMKIVGRGNVIIGDNFHSGPECLMLAEIHNYDHGKAIPYDDTYIQREIVIEDNVWLGSRVIVLDGITIGEGAIIQAGSVVTSNIPKCAIAGGHPAIVFKYRDIAHYDKLKQEGKFH